MDIKSKEYLKYRNDHASRVTRESDGFMYFYDKAAAMVFEGSTKNETIDALAPCGCDHTQSQGVVAGACQAARLLRFEKEETL